MRCWLHVEYIIQPVAEIVVEVCTIEWAKAMLCFCILHTGAPFGRKFLVISEIYCIYNSMLFNRMCNLYVT